MLEEVTIELERVKKLYEHRYVDDIILFMQTWPSTSLGFDGCGGDAFTTATTIIIFRGEYADVYFGGRFAYTVKAVGNDNFYKDLQNWTMKPVRNKEYYG